jgi:hypothetical protein
MDDANKGYDKLMDIEIGGILYCTNDSSRRSAACIPYDELSGDCFSSSVFLTAVEKSRCKLADLEQAASPRLNRCVETLQNLNVLVLEQKPRAEMNISMINRAMQHSTYTHEYMIHVGWWSYCRSRDQLSKAIQGEYFFNRRQDDSH